MLLKFKKNDYLIKIYEIIQFCKSNHQLFLTLKNLCFG